MEIVAENAIEKWRKLIGPTSTQTAKAEAPDSLRALFGTDNTQNAVHGSDSGPSMKRET
jgi:nucleoside diphosphate kinase